MQWGGRWTRKAGMGQVGVTKTMGKEDDGVARSLIVRAVAH